MSHPIKTLSPVKQPRRRKALIAGAAAAALVISWGGPAANAFWQTLSSADVGGKADSVQAMAAAPTASASAGAASVSWAKGSTAAGRDVSSYTVARYSSATGAKVAAGPGCAGTITALSCTEATLPAGTWYYTITPALGYWVGPESARSRGVVIADTTKPDAPIIGAAGTVNIGNKANAPVSGTAAAGVSSVTVTATDASGLQRFSQAVSPNGGQWAVSGFDLAGLGDGVITYTAVAKNAAGNVSNPSTAKTTTMDTVAPTATVELKNGTDTSKNKVGFADAGDTVVLTYSEAMNASSICSAWTSNSTDYTINGNDLVSVQISAAKVLTVTATGCSTLRIGDIVLDGVYSANTAPLVFGGNGNNVSSIAWNAGAKTLSLTFGKLASGTPAATAAAAGHPTVAPPAGVTDTAGNQAVGGASAAPSRF